MPIEPYVEAPTVRIRATPTSGSDTTAIDPYRQGVELTIDKYRYQGPMKLSAGTPDHSMYDAVFGQVDHLEPVTEFADADEYTARLFLTASEATCIGQPISNLQGSFAELYDGVLEPLEIRSIAAHSSIDFPYPAHGIYASFQEGNPDLFDRSEQITDIKKVSVAQGLAYIDAQDTFGSATLPGYVSEQSPAIVPFIDVVHSRSIEAVHAGAVAGASPSLIDDVDMAMVLVGASSSLEPMLLIDEISMTAGMTYAVPVRKELLSGSGTVTGYKLRRPYSLGTDSIAFGGLLQ